MYDALFIMLSMFKINCKKRLGNTPSPCKILNKCLQIMPPSMTESLGASKRPTALYKTNVPNKCTILCIIRELTTIKVYESILC
jgi:hypothetical protein